MIVGLVAITCYARFANNFFTGRDLPGLLLAVKDKPFQEVLSVPLLGGRNYYRPIASLSYAMDYQLFGLTPWGYHATNIFIHGMVVLSTYILVKAFLKSPALALLAAIVVAVHPATAEVVPDISYRMDLLGTLFSVLSVASFIWVFQLDREKAKTKFVVGLSLSVLSFLLGILSKEIAFVTVFIVGLYAFVFVERFDLKQRILNSLIATLPYVVVMFPVLAVRQMVLGNPWGQVFSGKSYDLVGRLKDGISYTVTYFWFLLFPQFPSPIDFESNQLIEFLRANASILAILMLWLLLVALNIWSSVRKEHAYWKMVFTARITRILFFLVGWLIFALFVFLATLFRFRYMYFAVVPLAILISMCCFSLLQKFIALLHHYRNGLAVNKRDLSMNVMGTGLVLLILLQWLYLSALFKPYNAYNESGMLVSSLVKQMEVFSENSKDGARATVYVENLPIPRREINFADPRPRELGNIWIPEYYRLFYGNSGIDWCVKSVALTEKYYVPYQIKTENGDFKLQFETSIMDKKTDFASCSEEFSFLNFARKSAH
jgi:hypothetical protein